MSSPVSMPVSLPEEKSIEAAATIEERTVPPELIENADKPQCIRCKHFGISHPQLPVIPPEKLAEFMSATALSHGICLLTPNMNLVTGQQEYRLAMYMRLETSLKKSCGVDGVFYEENNPNN